MKSTIEQAFLSANERLSLNKTEQFYYFYCLYKNPNIASGERGMGDNIGNVNDWNITEDRKRAIESAVQEVVFENPFAHMQDVSFDIANNNDGRGFFLYQHMSPVNLFIQGCDSTLENYEYPYFISSKIAEEYAENELGERLFAGESKQVLFEKSYKNLSPRERREMSDDFKEIKSLLNEAHLAEIEVLNLRSILKDYTERKIRDEQAKSQSRMPWNKTDPPAHKIDSISTIIQNYKKVNEKLDSKVEKLNESVEQMRNNPDFDSKKFAFLWSAQHYLRTDFHAVNLLREEYEFFKGRYDVVKTRWGDRIKEMPEIPDWEKIEGETLQMTGTRERNYSDPNNFAVLLRDLPLTHSANELRAFVNKVWSDVNDQMKTLLLAQYNNKNYLEAAKELADLRYFTQNAYIPMLQEVLRRGQRLFDGLEQAVPGNQMGIENGKYDVVIQEKRQLEKIIRELRMEMIASEIYSSEALTMRTRNILLGVVGQVSIQEKDGLVNISAKYENNPAVVNKSQINNQYQSLKKEVMSGITQSKEAIGAHSKLFMKREKSFDGVMLGATKETLKKKKSGAEIYSQRNGKLGIITAETKRARHSQSISVKGQVAEASASKKKYKDGKETVLYDARIDLGKVEASLARDGIFISAKAQAELAKIHTQVLALSANIDFAKYGVAVDTSLVKKMEKITDNVFGKILKGDIKTAQEYVEAVTNDLKDSVDPSKLIKITNDFLPKASVDFAEIISLNESFNESLELETSDPEISATSIAKKIAEAIEGKKQVEAPTVGSSKYPIFDPSEYEMVANQILDTAFEQGTLDRISIKDANSKDVVFSLDKMEKANPGFSDVFIKAFEDRCIKEKEEIKELEK